MNLLYKVIMGGITLSAALVLTVSKFEEPESLSRDKNGFIQASDILAQAKDTIEQPKPMPPISETSSSMADMDHSNMAGMDHSKMGMSHKAIAVPESKRVPQINLELFRDPMDGFNLHIEVKNFDLEAPEFAKQKPKNWLQGHAHLFVNGVKIQRVYDKYVHIPAKHFVVGPNQVMLSLNAHNHDYWASDNKPIMASIFLDPAKESFVLHSFSASPIAKK